MFIVIKNSLFGYNKFLVENLYVSNTIEEAREKAFEIIKKEYMEEYMEEYNNETPDIIKYDEEEADITYDFEEAYTTKEKSSIFVTISKPTY
jgi:hypothetical protein